MRNSSSCRRPGIAKGLALPLLEFSAWRSSWRLSSSATKNFSLLLTAASCRLRCSATETTCDWPGSCSIASPFDEALTLIREGLQRFAAHHGASQIYHETLTIAWVKLLATHQERASTSFSEATDIVSIPDCCTASGHPPFWIARLPDQVGCRRIRKLFPSDSARFLFT